jgi:hypothetical protein
MEGGNINFWLQLLIGAIGGLISGGVISIIEIARFRREKKRWENEDKKLKISIINAEYAIIHWDVNIRDDVEKLRIYETGLNGKVKAWRYFIKVFITNMTNQEILAHNFELDIPIAKLTKPEKIEQKYKPKRFFPTNRRYDLFEKNIIEDQNFPIVIPPHANKGIIFIGHYEYDYPYLVQEVETKYKLKIVIDDNVIIEEIVEPQLMDGFYKLKEIEESSTDSSIHWTQYMDKFKIPYDPFPF